MDELKVFSSPQFGEVRTVTEGGVTLFCGSDAAKALGYKRPNDAITAHCKGTVKRRTPTKGGMQEMLFITEGDIYRLAAKSELPGAEAFERWIFDEVLPAIRLTGGYTVRALENDLETATVNFLGSPLLAVRDMDGQVWVGVKWTCNGIGLSDGQAKHQSDKLQKDKVLRQGAKLFQLNTNGGRQTVLCLKLDYVPLWLATIRLTPAMQRDRPEVAGRLTEYQLKMRDAVAAALLDSGKIPLMQALVKMEQRQKAQDYALQNLSYRLTQLENPADLTAIADSIQSAAEALREALKQIPPAPVQPLLPSPGPAPARRNALAAARCSGILYRAAKKAGTTVEVLEAEARRRAEAITGAGVETASDAYVRAVEDMARWYKV